MATATPLIEVKDVTVERDFTSILEGFSWSVQAGQNWVIFGPNGAGKTSLLNVIQGYMWPTNGKVTVLGGELGNGVDVREMRREMSVVSEPVRNMINSGLTGLEVLVTGSRAHLDIFADPTIAEIKRARELASRTTIEFLLQKPFGVMSTGERQRLLITRALMPRPKVVILDEPCAGLDLAAREWVLQVIETAARQKNPPALLLTTHHVEEVTPSFTHALLIKAGKLFAAGPIADTFTSQHVSGLFDIRVHLNRNHGRFSAAAVQ